jgi:peptide/nickel transport system ATP-binding protein
MSAILDVRNLSVRYEPKSNRAVTAVSDVSFDIHPGEFVGIIGESGSGKSTLGNAVLRLLGRPARISDGTISFDGHDITHAPENDLRSLRWRDISAVFQSSMNSLNRSCGSTPSSPTSSRSTPTCAATPSTRGSVSCSTW